MGYEITQMAVAWATYEDIVDGATTTNSVVEWGTREHELSRTARGDALPFGEPPRDPQSLQLRCSRFASGSLSTDPVLVLHQMPCTPQASMDVPPVPTPVPLIRSHVLLTRACSHT